MFRLLFVISVMWNITAHATTISYEAHNLGGNSWEYVYEINNDTLNVDLEEFSIFFDLGLYENLVATGTPSGWDPLVLQPDPFIPDNGLYDALALFVPGIAPGSSQSGFAVQFDFLGSGTPGIQSFEIVDPVTFNLLDSGSTILKTDSGGNKIPVPSTIWLLISGLIGLSSLMKARNKTPQ